MPKLTLVVLPQCFTIHRFAPDTTPPSSIFSQQFYFIGRTDEALSVVVNSDLPLASQTNEPNWRALKVAGPLDFSLTGIIAGISSLLAQVNISIFSLSTFDTDYILVKSDQLAQAISTLAANDNYKIENLACNKLISQP